MTAPHADRDHSEEPLTDAVSIGNESTRQRVSVLLPSRILGRPWTVWDLRELARWADQAGSGEAADVLHKVADALPNVPTERPAHDGWAPLGLDDQGRSLGSTQTTASVTVPLQAAVELVRERDALRAEIADRESERADLREALANAVAHLGESEAALAEERAKVARVETFLYRISGHPLTDHRAYVEGLAAALAGPAQPADRDATPDAPQQPTQPRTGAGTDGTTPDAGQAVSGDTRHATHVEMRTVCAKCGQQLGGFHKDCDGLWVTQRRTVTEWWD